MNADFDGSGRSMTRRSFIEKLPPILILHLKRFVYDGHGTKKVWKKIAYPLSLEIPLDVLSPTQRGDGPPKFQLFGGIPPPQTRSRLTIVIYHHGTSATGGHYTADVLLQDGRTWLNLDDTKLKWVDAAQVAVSEKDGNWGEVDNHQVNGEDSAVGWNNMKSKVAYILLYKRFIV
jgi:ubiquitin carboxyl-terminal hydrolase 10